MIHIFALTMRNIAKHTLTVIMAALVFYGGAGINIISYCCNQCRSAGIKALFQDKCCEIHNHNHTHAANKRESPAGHSCCAKTGETDQHFRSAHHEKSCNHCTDHTSGNCCNMERIDFDWNTQNTTGSDTNLSPVVVDLLPSGAFDRSITDHLVCEAGAIMSNGPPLVCPREYLSRLTILLI